MTSALPPLAWPWRFCVLATLLAGTSLSFGQWASPINLSDTDGRYSGGASWQFDSNGKIHMAFHDFIDTDYRFYYAHNVNGYWTKTSVKHYSASGTGGPSLIITPDQIIHILYNHAGGTYRIAKPVSGGSWSASERIDNSQAAGCPVPDPSHPSEWPTSNYFASADGDSTGGIFVTWMSLFNDNFSPRNAVWGRYRAPDGTWGCLELVASSGNDGNFPGDIHVTHNGSDIFVTWSDRNGCYYRKRASNGTWSGTVSVASHGSHCRMAFAPTGEWAVCYHHDTGGGASDPWFECFLRTSTNQGASWSSAYNFSNRIGLDRSPSPTYDANGDLHILYELFPCDGCKAEVYYIARLNNVWQPRHNLTDRYGGRDSFNYYDEVIQAHNGNLYAVVNSTVDAYEDVWIHQTAPQIDLSRSSFDRNTWIGTNLPSDAFTVTNGGPNTINYTITDNVPWLSVSPASGASSGESDTITVQYNVGAFLAGTYTGTITVSSPEAWNSPQQIAVTVEIEAVNPDFDGDGDVDLDDFGHLQNCLTGSGIEQTDPDCLDARLDFDNTYYGDTDVDLDDFAILSNCFTGATVFADPACDDF